MDLKEALLEFEQEVTESTLKNVAKALAHMYRFEVFSDLTAEMMSNHIVNQQQLWCNRDLGIKVNFILTGIRISAGGLSVTI